MRMHFYLVSQSIWNVSKLYDAEGPRLRADTYYLLDILKAYEAHSFQHRGLSRDSHIGTLGLVIPLLIDPYSSLGH